MYRQLRIGTDKSPDAAGQHEEARRSAFALVIDCDPDKRAIVARASLRPLRAAEEARARDRHVETALADQPAGLQGTKNVASRRTDHDGKLSVAELVEQSAQPFV